MKKVLFTASIPKHFIAFHLPYLEWFKKQGYEVHVACNEFAEIPFVDKLWLIPFSRSPKNFGKHLKSFAELRKIIKLQRFDIIHCHTPVASIVSRLASASLKKRTPHQMMYTAHGFHFFKGGALSNWLLYYPIEKLMTYYTDYLICINEEDFNFIKNKGSKGCKYFKIPGIGVSNDKFFPVSYNEKLEIRTKLGFTENDFILVYGAEFIDRKNHNFLIQTISEFKQDFLGVKVVFAGSGELFERIKESIDSNDLKDIVFPLGYRKDIDKLYKMADIGISVSKQEGLGINLIEAMLCGAPIIASEDRGHKEIISNEHCGYIYPQNNKENLINAILMLKNDSALYLEYSTRALQRGKQFSIEKSLDKMSVIYLDAINAQD